MDKAKVQELSSLYEKLETVNRMIDDGQDGSGKTFAISNTNADGDDFESLDIGVKAAMDVLISEQHALVEKIQKLGGTV